MDIIVEYRKLGCDVHNNGFHLYVIQEWLRDKKNIHVEVEHFINEYETVMYMCYIDRRNIIEPDRGYVRKSFDSYKKALEYGLLWQLKYMKSWG